VQQIASQAGCERSFRWLVGVVDEGSLAKVAIDARRRTETRGEAGEI